VALPRQLTDLLYIVGEGREEGATEWEKTMRKHFLQLTGIGECG
jgi:hypothetical protein